MEVARSRDVVVLVKGDTIPVTVGETTALLGWSGGQGVRWTTPSKDEFTVELSDGVNFGFMLWGSDETADQYVSTTRNQAHYRFATVGVGGWHILTSTYERYTWASRQVGPLVPLTFVESDRLVFSLRGYWTTEDEWALSGDPRAPNDRFAGVVTQAPGPTSFLGIQTQL